MDNKIKAIIFDYGGVICHKQNDESVINMINILGIAKEDFSYYYKKFRVDYDKGIINGIDYWKNILNAINLNLNEDKIKQLAKIDLDSWTNINKKMIELIKKIKPSFNKIAILSNMHFDCLNFLEKNYNWLSLFDEKIFSCNLRLVKPDLLIYKYCIDRINLQPMDCLFVDDTEENILVGRSLGLRTILFNSFNDFKKELYKKYL